ncbi:MAG: hypothetical protein LCH92_08280 [Proteobacteria bacterium]|nr:hypothetical protein [Pseudomonadota bacterium]
MRRLALYLAARFYEARALRAMRVWAICNQKAEKFSSLLREFARNES